MCVQGLSVTVFMCVIQLCLCVLASHYSMNVLLD